MRQVCKRSIGAALIAVLLSACSSQKDDTPGLTSLILGSVKEIATSRGSGPLQKIEISPAELAKVQVALLQVNPEARGGSDFLQRVATRNDSALGTVVIWESSDKAQVFLRNGVVVGTRGIGGDIIAASAQSTVSALARRANGSGVRSYFISDGDVTTTQFQFRCDISNLGAERISLANQVISTDHLQEECIGGPTGKEVLRNEYWVQTSTGTVRKSRQWMGPRIGYFELIVLKN